MVCPKCFESNDDTAEFCKDCGAPLKDGADASDQHVYTELARANLFRVRADYKGASDVCLGILRKFPNNPTAHTLLGDICADQGDLRQAATWYEMALDLVPDSPAEVQKLASVQERLSAKDAAESALQIGIPEHQPKVWPYIVLVGILLVSVGAGAYFLGRGPQVKSAEGTIQTPVKVTPTETAQGDTSVPPKTEESTQTQQPVASLSADAAILRGLTGSGAERLTFISASQDPRGPTATVSVAEVTAEHPTVTATRSALEFFKVFAAYTKVTIRVIGSDGIVLVADMSQQAASTAKAAIEGGDTVESQAQVMLANVWTPSTSPQPEALRPDPNKPDPTKAPSDQAGH